MNANERHIADFVVSAWGAWAPGLNSREDWRQFQQGLLDIGTQEPPSPKSVPKSLLRRLSPMAKAVFVAIEPCIEKGARLPAVFSSSHGEIVKSLQILETLQQGEELSPTAFSLSVHNAIAGLFSIAFGNQQEISVLAPGRDGLASGFMEALGLLQEGQPEVLLVFYDEPLPSFYPVEPFKLNLPYSCAVALRLAPAGEGLPLSLLRSDCERLDGEQAWQLPAFIDFLLSERQRIGLGNAGHSWLWLKGQAQAHGDRG